MHPLSMLIVYGLIVSLLVQQQQQPAEAMPLGAPLGKPKFCGKALNDMLDLVCVNGFYPKIKRTRRQNIEPSVLRLDERTKRRKRHRRLGIVHECCHNGCVYTDIVRYCR